MTKEELKDYHREYNKAKYKTVKVYIPTDEYPKIEEYIKNKGFKVSEYMRKLLEEDMQNNKQA
ncbi:MAG: hypothetical protein NC122_10120 [Faecalibacterium sp.]|nr:hypothetical protein [Ruminococcus sp.]MCM1393231.1 hypothetical protein [Ruminococcus sp.]MCM1486546.1 hypothetical protein [Faecalibacterium sp.]